MYLPAHFEENRSEVLHALIRKHDLGTLVAVTAGGLEANHLPFELDVQPDGNCVLRAHVARANPIWRESSAEVDALVVFQGAHSYISPSWYPSKQEDGRVVPTYNYMVVHAYGPMRAVHDATWLRGLVERLTGGQEASRVAPWKVDDAPADYIEKMLTAIVGIEIPVRKMVGKWKVSQNRSVADRIGVVDGLRQLGDENSVTMADTIKT